jgi:hypothetical protein
MQRARVLTSLFAASVFIVLLVPFQPSMPVAALDPSWQLSLNQAVENGLVFGRDVIFTCGPYAALITSQYHPATYLRAVAVALFLAAFLFAAIQAISRGTGALWTVALLLSILAVPGSMVELLGAYGLILSIALVRHCAEARREEGWQKTLFLATLFAPLGLLPLTKLNLLLFTATLIPAQFAFLWLNGRRGLAACSVAVPAATLVASWLLAGQPLQGLPAYFESGFSVMFGYSDAMSNRGPTSEIVVYLLVALPIPLAIMLSARRSLPSRLLLLFSCGVFLFVSFKAGFVRHDSHAMNAAAGLVVAATLLKFATPANRAVAAIVLASLAGAGFIDIHYVEPTASLITGPYIRAAKGLEREISGADLEAAYFASLEEIRSQTKILPLEGTVDIYSYGQTALIASGNEWAPRPNLQSHAAYTPALAEADRDYLLERGPDNVVFRIETIDNRFPSLEDGASWPVLLDAYRLDKSAGGYLYLRRRSDVSMPEMRPVEEGVHRFNEEVGVPDSRDPLFMKIRFHKNLLGKLVSALFRNPSIWIVAELANGETRRYRLIPGMTETGFVVSPIVETIEEFAALYDDQASLAGKQVKSFRVTGRGFDLFWRQSYEIRIEALEPGPGG